MIFYGDVSRRVAPRELCSAVADFMAQACGPAPAIDRHAAWVGALLAAGELAQGLADAALQFEGFDESTEPGSAALVLAVALAEVMGLSCDTAGRTLPTSPPPRVREAFARLEGLDLRRGDLEIRRAEGFAHYGVYPEAYWIAARSPGSRPDAVIGIRSIGTTLAAAVSASVGVALPLTVRPLGHPFAREARLGPGFDAAVRRGAGAVWAVVDEGPGLSGSSFSAVADALAARGTPPSRVVLFPSHGNPPGAMADGVRRRFWDAAERRVADADHVLAARAADRGLARWVEDITGPSCGEPIDVSGGLWRAHRFRHEDDWPAVDRQNERRKYLIDGSNGRFLVKFVGLGAFGQAKHTRARVLAAAGFTPPPLALRHGFLVEPWLGDASPLQPGEHNPRAFLDHLARYLGFRARTFPATARDGASLGALLTMARTNAGEALGSAVDVAFQGWSGHVARLTGLARPVAIDGRLQAGEWLVDRQGRWLKTDALDHSCGHDLVGCQDIAWDVAGAAIEYRLSATDTEKLRHAVAREAGRDCDPDLVALFRLAYAGFAVGTLTLARGRETGPDATRLDHALELALQALQREIVASPGPTPRG